MYAVKGSPGRVLGSVALRYRHPAVWRPWPPARRGPQRSVGSARPDRDDESAKGPTARSERMARLEAALFLAREPMGSRKLADLAGLADGTEARTLVGKLNRMYDSEGCAFRAVEVAGGFQLMSRAKFVPWLRRLHASPVEVRLSAPAMETLAVVAYRQPVLRAEIEAVRGVQCGEILRQLMEREMVRIVGRSEELGRPFLYGTTKRFLEVFGMRHLEELPRPRLAQAGGAVRPEPAPFDPLETGAAPETTSRPIDSSKTEGEPKVTSASETIVVVEENTASAIEEASGQALSADEDHNNLAKDDEDYDEDDYDDERGLRGRRVGRSGRRRGRGPGRRGRGRRRLGRRGLGVVPRWTPRDGLLRTAPVWHRQVARRWKRRC